MGDESGGWTDFNIANIFTNMTNIYMQIKCSYVTPILWSIFNFKDAILLTNG
jgi:hypothetical protein